MRNVPHARKPGTHLPVVDVYYRPEMSLGAGSNENARNASKSPSKPGRFMAHLLATPVSAWTNTEGRFEAMTDDEFKTAHYEDYVDGFFAGDPKVASTNGLAWSPEFAETVRYTNASLVTAVIAANLNPGRIAMSPTSGFHHARPGSGGGFCTFSGQVISALHVYRNLGKVGAWIDLDGHFGNSIEDSRKAIEDLNLAIPIGCNLNPSGEHTEYLRNLLRGLSKIGKKVIAGEVDYVCFAHGADSHEWDDLGFQCSTGEWLRASDLVYRAIRDWSEVLGRPVPVVLAMFGGYRRDNPESVLELHVADLARAVSILGGAECEYEPKVAKPAPRELPAWLRDAPVKENRKARRARMAAHRAANKAIGYTHVNDDEPDWGEDPFHDDAAFNRWLN